MGNWNTGGGYGGSAGDFDDSYNAAMGYGGGGGNDNNDSSPAPVATPNYSYTRPDGIEVVDYSISAAQNPRNTYNFSTGLPSPSLGGGGSDVARSVLSQSVVQPDPVSYPGASSIPAVNALTRSYSDIKGLVTDALSKMPTDILSGIVPGVQEQSSVTGITGLASRARQQALEPAKSPLSTISGALGAVGEGIQSLRDISIPAFGGDLGLDLNRKGATLTYTRQFNKGGEAVAQDYVFEPRVTDPRRPSDIPLAERQAYADLDKMAETGFRSYLGYKADREDYQQGLRNLIANDPMGPQLQARNEDAMLDYLDYMQFYAPDTADVFPSDRLAREAAIYKGKIPYGFEDDAVLYGRRTPSGIAVTHGAHVQKGFEDPEIFLAGRRSTGPNTPYHEGYHDISTPQYAPSYRIPGEEEGVRAIDYYRAIALGNEDMLTETVRNMGFDPTSPEGRRQVRENALSMMVGIDDDTYKGFSPADRAEFVAEYESRINRSDTSGIMGNINKALEAITGPDFEKPFEYMLNEAPQSEFIEFLKRAPAYRKAASMYNDPKPREDVKAAVRGYRDGGEAEGGVFEQKEGYNYGSILPISRNLETGEKGFDLAGGITGAFGRGLETFERQLSGQPVSDQELVAAGLDVIPVGAGVANVAAPAAAPGILGAFYAKHASPKLIRGRLRPTGDVEPTMGTSVAGPGVYLGEQTDDILSYALKEADRKPVTEADEAFNVGRNVETKGEALELLANQAHNQMYDVANGKAYYFMKDGSLVVDNFKTGQIERRGKGTGYIYNTLVDANKDEFLDFRKSLADQAPKVKEALASMKLQLNISSSDMGDTIYQRLRNELGGETAANNFLKGQGLAGSVFNQRGKEMMVVFDPDKLDVTVVQPVSNVPAKKR